MFKLNKYTEKDKNLKNYNKICHIGKKWVRLKKQVKV